MHSKQYNHPKGFTIVELLIAIAISGLALVLLSKLLTVSLNTYNIQEQISDMNQNARYTLNELSSVIMQAGSDLQIMSSDSIDRDTIIIPDGRKSVCNGFTIKINPRGGLYQFPQKTGFSLPKCTVYVEKAKNFKNADKIQRIPLLSSSRGIRYYSLISIDTLLNYVVFSPRDSFLRGDVICSFIKKRYYLKKSDLCLDFDNNIISENIDSLLIEFFDRDYNPTAQWPEMVAAKNSCSGQVGSSR
ncbi:MAG TPA: prepilin-type N-terminal cleavage/methylation domain-containing protein [Chitinispirillaceae bacterium]|nr:prepilin-type N-terminal cleavage/methylation domain-containing protein [Chitinispirillaceae bacterium]